MTTGILLTNIGSPDEPTPRAVRQYLKKFLSDRRVVEIPSIIWQPILHTLILPFRSKKSASLYQQIWTEQGSPLLLFSKKIATHLEKKIKCPVEIGMHYGNPSIADALLNLRAKNISQLIILPLYPQYSATTTGATFDYVAKTLKHWRTLPDIRMIRDYANHPDYIDALCSSIQTHWNNNGRADHLLFSFHGIPQKYADASDPYPELCQTTAHLVAEKLFIKKEEWSLAFQSRLGRAKWLMPYTDKTLQAFPARGIKNIEVICPGFAADCLETLEEINIRGREQFLKAGGEKFYYIPALNDDEKHISALEEIVNGS